MTEQTPVRIFAEKCRRVLDLMEKQKFSEDHIRAITRGLKPGNVDKALQQLEAWEKEDHER